MIKGPCATLVLCGRAVLSGLVNKPYMNCKQHENFGKALAANCYGSPGVQRDFGRSFAYLRTSAYFVAAILISDYQKLAITGKQDIFVVAKQ